MWLFTLRLVAKKLISNLLVVNRHRRYMAVDVLCDPFILTLAGSRHTDHLTTTDQTDRHTTDHPATTSVRPLAAGSRVTDPTSVHTTDHPITTTDHPATTTVRPLAGSRLTDPTTSDRSSLDELRNSRRSELEHRAKQNRLAVKYSATAAAAAASTRHG